MSTITTKYGHEHDPPRRWARGIDLTGFAA